MDDWIIDFSMNPIIQYSSAPSFHFSIRKVAPQRRNVNNFPLAFPTL